MIKMILGVFITIFVIVTAVVVFYWRDINHDPSTQDMLLFFGLLPLALSMLFVMPFMIRQWYQESQEKKQKEQQADRDQDDEVAELPPEKIMWTDLNVFSSKSLSALGEDEAIWEELKNFKSPELDSKLLNGYGLPILSYRIPEIDDMLESEEEDEFDQSNKRQKRIEALINYQLEQNTETLWAIAEHLKQSALFYEGQLVHEYRMHPAWIDPNADREDDDQIERTIEQVSKLSRLDVHLILAEDLLHIWDEEATKELIGDFFTELGIIPQKFHVELHYWGKETAYKEWMNLLQQVQKAEDIVSFVVVADSEIDQDTVDEKTWVSEQYLPSEFVGSCCIAKTSVLINNMQPLKTIKIALNESKLQNTLEQLNIHQLEQYQQEQPFVIQLDDITDLKVVKRLNHNFSDTPIEQHHYLYMKSSVGQTEHVAKIFGFILATQASDELMSMVYCCDLPQTQSFIQAITEQDTSVERDA